MLPLEEIKLDRENAFLLYATFCGDVVRTAAACGVRPIDILRVADECGWAERLKPIIELSKSAKPGDIERGINRGVNFAQAHRMRMFLNRVVDRVCGMTPDELEKYLLNGPGQRGEIVEKLSTRALADLASALEKCHAMTYQALGDTAPERAKSAQNGTATSASDLHVKIAEAMQRIRADGSPRAQLFDAQIEQAESFKPEPSKNPNDNDDH